MSSSSSFAPAPRHTSHRTSRESANANVLYFEGIGSKPHQVAQAAPASRQPASNRQSGSNSPASRGGTQPKEIGAYQRQVEDALGAEKARQKMATDYSHAGSDPNLETITQKLLRLQGGRR